MAGAEGEGDLCELTCLSAYVAAFPNMRRGIREPTNRFIIARLSASARSARGALEPRMCKRIFLQLPELLNFFMYSRNISAIEFFSLSFP